MSHAHKDLSGAVAAIKIPNDNKTADELKAHFNNIASQSQHLPQLHNTHVKDIKTLCSTAPDIAKKLFARFLQDAINKYKMQFHKDFTQAMADKIAGKHLDDLAFIEIRNHDTEHPMILAGKKQVAPRQIKKALDEDRTLTTQYHGRVQNHQYAECIHTSNQRITRFPFLRNNSFMMRALAEQSTIPSKNPADVKNVNADIHQRILIDCTITIWLADALALDKRTLANAYFMRASTKRFLQWHPQEIINDAIQSLALEPTNAFTKALLEAFGLKPVETKHDFTTTTPKALALLANAPRKLNRCADYLARARSSLATGDFDLAIQYCFKAQNIEPANYEIHIELGVAYREQGKYDFAKAQFLTAQTLNPSSPLTLAQLARLEEVKRTPPRVDTAKHDEKAIAIANKPSLAPAELTVKYKAPAPTPL